MQLAPVGLGAHIADSRLAHASAGRRWYGILEGLSLLRAAEEGFTERTEHWLCRPVGWEKLLESTSLST